jgi:uncharacterized protein YeaO (DUF488 family)
MAVKTKRVYDPASSDDGHRLLVMRTWPRGVKKGAVDEWEKELGAPKDLIKDWKGGNCDWAEFKKRYRKAMKDQKDRIAEVAERARVGTVTLLCGCEDEKHCHRALLKQMIERQQKKKD